MASRGLRRLPLMILAAFAGGLAAQTPPAAPVEVRIVSLMPDFWRFWRLAQGRSPSQQAALFRSTVIAAHTEAYSPAVLQLPAGPGFESALNSAIARFVAALPARVEAMRALEPKLETAIPRSVWAFTRLFPDLRGPVIVYLMPSLGRFSGEQRPVQGRFVLLIGVDNLLHGAALEGLIEHELFHFYHFQKVRPFETVAPMAAMPTWWWVWEEGFATYAVQLLNPGWPARDVFFSPTDLPAETARHLPHLARLVRQDMDRPSALPLYAALLAGGRAEARRIHADLPARSGYVLGYRLVERLSRRYPLARLVSLTGAELRALVAAELAAMSTHAFHM
jgi:hypothetical protein